MGEPIVVHYRRGVHLPEVGLWLDPDTVREVAFVSHAHADHFARHRKIICSKPTRDLMAVRYGTGKSEVVALEYGEEGEVNGWRFKLLPAGHILGSAQILITRPIDGATLLFSGDFKTRPGVSCEKTEFEKADTFVMETTFGQPRYVFPPTEKVIADVLKFAREAIESGEIPVLLAYSLGKAQEILAFFHGAGIPVMVHETVSKMTKIYERYTSAFPPYKDLDPGQLDGHVVIAPPNSSQAKEFRKMGNTRLAMLSGWGLDPRAKYRYRVDEVFPLSDHSDYPGLLEAVEKVAPARVLTMHGYAHDFARDLRALGYEAWSLLGDNQLELPLDGGNPLHRG